MVKGIYVLFYTCNLKIKLAQRVKLYFNLYILLKTVIYIMYI